MATHSWISGIKPTGYSKSFFIHAYVDMNKIWFGNTYWIICVHQRYWSIISYELYLVFVLQWFWLQRFLGMPPLLLSFFLPFPIGLAVDLLWKSGRILLWNSTALALFFNWMDLNCCFNILISYNYGLFGLNMVVWLNWEIHVFYYFTLFYSLIEYRFIKYLIIIFWTSFLSFVC